MTKVGFIGLGIMGAPMAANLQAGGCKLYLHDHKNPPAALIEGGATVCTSGAEVAKRADIIIVMVPDTPHVASVLFDADGVAAGLTAGKIVVDMSSISPMETKVFAQKINKLNCEYLDAPVSGGEVGARAASLTIMVGGSEEAFGIVKPLFEMMGKNITLVGGNGDGQTTKVANQIIVALNIQAVSEALAVRLQGRRRSGQGAPGADGRLRFVAHPRGAWRAHDQAHLRAWLPHRAAPEGPEPGAAGRQGARRVAAEHRDRAGADEFLRRAWHERARSLVAVPGHRTDVEPRDREGLT